MLKIWSVLPIRWIVEHSFAWSSCSRRLSKDYEITIESAENMFMISHLVTLLRRFWGWVLSASYRENLCCQLITQSTTSKQQLMLLLHKIKSQSSCLSRFCRYCLAQEVIGNLYTKSGKLLYMGVNFLLPAESCVIVTA